MTFGTRPKLAENQNCLSFKHPDFPVETFNILHPHFNTKDCDVIILPFNQDPDHQKQVAIPMHRSLLQMIPYFQGQLKNNVEWRETRTQSQTVTSNFITLEMNTDVDARTVFDYLETFYKYTDQNFEWITKQNCLEVLILAKFWCDEFVAAHAESFIKKNIDRPIYDSIMNNVELRSLLESVVKQFTDYLFAHVKNPDLCFVTSTKMITKFDKTRSTDSETMKFMNDYSDVFSKNNFTWEDCFTEPVSDDHSKTVINFKPFCSKKTKFWCNFIVGVIDKHASETDVLNSADIKNCVFRFESKVCSGSSKLNCLRCSYDCNGELVSVDVPRINKTAPLSDFKLGESFKLVYNRGTHMLTLSNNRGFSHSVSYCAEGCRFFFKLSGFGVSLLNIKEKEDGKEGIV